jgi:hypothetical protein
MAKGKKGKKGKKGFIAGFIKKLTGAGAAGAAATAAVTSAAGALANLIPDNLQDADFQDRPIPQSAAIESKTPDAAMRLIKESLPLLAPPEIDEEVFDKEKVEREVMPLDESEKLNKLIAYEAGVHHEIKQSNEQTEANTERMGELAEKIDKYFLESERQEEEDIREGRGRGVLGKAWDTAKGGAKMWGALQLAKILKQLKLLGLGIAGVVGGGLLSKYAEPIANTLNEWIFEPLGNLADGITETMKSLNLIDENADGFDALFKGWDISVAAAFRGGAITEVASKITGGLAKGAAVVTDKIGSVGAKLSSTKGSFAFVKNPEAGRIKNALQRIKVWFNNLGPRLKSWSQNANAWLNRFPYGVRQTLQGAFRKIQRVYYIWEALTFIANATERYALGMITAEEYHKNNKEQLQEIVRLIGGPGVGALIGALISAAGGAIATAWSGPFAAAIGAVSGALGGTAGFILGVFYGDKLISMLGIDQLVGAIYDQITKQDDAALSDLMEKLVNYFKKDFPEFLEKAVFATAEWTYEKITGLNLDMSSEEDIVEEYGENITTENLLFEAMEGLGTDEGAIYYALQDKTWNDYEKLAVSYKDQNDEDLTERLKSELREPEFLKIFDPKEGILTVNSKERSEKIKVIDKVQNILDKIEGKKSAMEEGFGEFGDVSSFTPESTTEEKEAIADMKETLEISEPKEEAIADTGREMFEKMYGYTTTIEDYDKIEYQELGNKIETAKTALKEFINIHGEPDTEIEYQETFKHQAFLEEQNKKPPEQRVQIWGDFLTDLEPAYTDKKIQYQYEILKQNIREPESRRRQIEQSFKDQEFSTIIQALEYNYGYDKDQLMQMFPAKTLGNINASGVRKFYEDLVQQELESPVESENKEMSEFSESKEEAIPIQTPETSLNLVQEMTGTPYEFSSEDLDEEEQARITKWINKKFTTYKQVDDDTSTAQIMYNLRSEGKDIIGEGFFSKELPWETISEMGKQMTAGQLYEIAMDKVYDDATNQQLIAIAKSKKLPDFYEKIIEKNGEEYRESFLLKIYENRLNTKGERITSSTQFTTKSSRGAIDGERIESRSKVQTKGITGETDLTMIEKLMLSEGVAYETSTARIRKENKGVDDEKAERFTSSLITQKKSSGNLFKNLFGFTDNEITNRTIIDGDGKMKVSSRDYGTIQRMIEKGKPELAFAHVKYLAEKEGRLREEVQDINFADIVDVNKDVKTDVAETTARRLKEAEKKESKTSVAVLPIVEKIQKLPEVKTTSIIDSPPQMSGDYAPTMQSNDSFFNMGRF